MNMPRRSLTSSALLPVLPHPTPRLPTALMGVLSLLHPRDTSRCHRVRLQVPEAVSLDGLEGPACGDLWGRTDQVGTMAFSLTVRHALSSAPSPHLRPGPSVSEHCPTPAWVVTKLFKEGSSVHSGPWAYWMGLHL